MPQSLLGKVKILKGPNKHYFELLQSNRPTDPGKILLTLTTLI